MVSRERGRKPKEKEEREGKKVRRERRQHKENLDGVPECQNRIKI
jgi:hypothetical protein